MSKALLKVMVVIAMVSSSTAFAVRDEDRVAPRRAGAAGRTEDQANFDFTTQCCGSNSMTGVTSAACNEAAAGILRSAGLQAPGATPAATPAR